MVTLTDVAATEVGSITWYAFDASGTRVGTDTVSGTPSSSVLEFSLPTNINYQYIAFTSTSTANFRVNGLRAEAAVTGNATDEFTYTLSDSDGSQAQRQHLPSIHHRSILWRMQRQFVNHICRMVRIKVAKHNIQRQVICLLTML